MSVVMSLVVVLTFLWEKDQAIHLVNFIYWTNGMLFWERVSVFVLTGKEKRLWTLSRVIWIRYDRVRPPEDLGNRKVKFEKIKQDK